MQGTKKGFVDDRSERQKRLDAQASLREALDLLDDVNDGEAVAAALESIDDAAYSLGRPNRQPFYLYRLMVAHDALEEWLKPGPSLGQPGGPDAAKKAAEALTLLRNALGCHPTACKAGCVCGWHEIQCAFDKLGENVATQDATAGH